MAAGADTDDSGEEQARFSCLAALRYTAAAVVSALAVVVIVMVIIVVVLRPENVGISVVQGHVRTSELYTETTYYTTRASSSCAGGGGGTTTMTPAAAAGSTTTTTTTRPPPGRCQQLRVSSTRYSPVGFLDLGVVLSVENPSGRDDVTCDNATVYFYDMPYWSDDDHNETVGVNITSFVKPGFVVKPQSSHRFWKALRLRDERVLAHIAATYGGRAGFTGKVNGTMVIHHHKSTRAFECLPVDFSVGDATDDYGDEDATVTCTVTTIN